MGMTWESPSLLCLGPYPAPSAVYSPREWCGDSLNILQPLMPFEQVGFQKIVDAIDGTHVQIIAPKDNENEFVNRHHYHSLNVQVVFDAQYKLIDIIAKWPGSTHDARILSESGLRVLFEKGHIPIHTHLLGDSGYPSRRWLLTPFRMPQPGPQTNYNR